MDHGAKIIFMIMESILDPICTAMTIMMNDENTVDMKMHRKSVIEFRYLYVPSVSFVLIPSKSIILNVTDSSTPMQDRKNPE